MTRRDFHGAVVGGLVATPLLRLGAAQKPDSRVAGVRIGAQSYSFRDIPGIDRLVESYVESGLAYCELWSNHVELRENLKGMEALAPREARRQWRLEVPLDYFSDIRKKFEAAGVTITAYNLSFTRDWTDEEIARGFEMARALGTNVITASSQVSMSPRLDPVAQKTGITVGFHHHSNVKDPDEFATPDSFAAAMKGRSNRIAINLDIGHFTAANFDAIDYLDKFHDRIVSLHIKDRRKNQGPNVPFGEGETPIVAVLQRLRDRKWDIPAQLEYEYKGTDAVTEVKRSFEYCKQALLAK
jgi:sugar phosphate isomerase/epimerase